MTDIDASVRGHYDIFGIVWHKMIVLLHFLKRSHFLISFGFELFFRQYQ